MNEVPSFWRVERIARARIAHRCVECGGRIPPQTSYVRLNGGWDGKAIAYKMHELCHKISEAQQAEWRRQGVDLGDLPPIGGMIDAAREDAESMGTWPPYWPAGVFIDGRELAKHIEEQANGTKETKV